MNPEQLPARVRDLLVVDDDPAQIFMFQYLLEEIGCRHKCHSAKDGLQALEFLHRQAAYSNAPRPELIILDIDMPGMNGCEVLIEIKRDPELCCIPVLMFSAGLDDEQVSRCYAERANAYLQKPRNYAATLKVVKEIERFWFQTATLPPPFTQGFSAT